MSFGWLILSVLAIEPNAVFTNPLTNGDLAVHSGAPLPHAGSEPTGFWDHPFIEECITGMNPLADYEYESLRGYFDPFSSQAQYGNAGPQPLRLGWTTYNDITYRPAAPTQGVSGRVDFLEWNQSVRYSELIRPGVVFDSQAWFNAEWWNGPAGVGLPSQFDQISLDTQLGFFGDSRWTVQVGFHPQIVGSLESKLNHNGFNFDGRVVATYKASETYSFVVGLAYWDRVDGLFIPHAGVIWTPNARWEYRLLFPQSRISYYVGRVGSGDAWLYGSAGYNVEAWQADVTSPRTHDRLQLSEETLHVGARYDVGRHSAFVEAGGVFDRHVKFAGPTHDFSIGNSAVIRVGYRY